MSQLKDVLVLSVRKGFWASSDAKAFPRCIYVFDGLRRRHKLLGDIELTLRAWIAIWIKRPQIVLFGAASAVVPWFIHLKQMRLLGKVRFLVLNQVSFTDDLAYHIERIIIYSRSQISLHDPRLHPRYSFIPLPADGCFNRSWPASEPNMVFSGGGEGRDYNSLIEAVKELPLRLDIIAFRPESFNNADLPSNCRILGPCPTDDFLGAMARAAFVVIPLLPGVHPHGHTTIVQAQRLGKVIVTTRNASVEDYVTEGEDGFLVEPGDVGGYRNAIQRLLQDQVLLHNMEKNVRAKMHLLTYSNFQKELIRVCKQMMSEDDCL
jgi:glycosyltransferase involved in cell wall biosynthesis